MRPLLALLALLALPGCVTSVSGPLSSAAAPPAACDDPWTETVLEWVAPEGSDSGETTFEVPVGATGLSFDWTPPSERMGGYALKASRPTGETVWEHVRGNAVQVGSVYVEFGGSHRSFKSVQTPPATDTYAFEHHVDGRLEDARFAVVVTGCS